ncbi:MAG: hypothetical protein K2Y33_02335 [Mycolicibacterium frederiksbergense]|nr:hypothetical protein [Mycolicibacterium frederiksbergense]
MSRFVISNLRVGPEELREQLPVTGTTIDVRTDPDGQQYFYARLDGPIKHQIDTHFDTSACSPVQLGADANGPVLWVTDIVMRSSTPGEQPHYGMHRFPVDLAYAIDLSYIDDPALDFGKILPIATAEIDDVPDDALADATPTPADGDAAALGVPEPVSTPAADLGTPAEGDTTTSPATGDNVAATGLDVEQRDTQTPEPAGVGGNATGATSPAAPVAPHVRPSRPSRPPVPEALSDTSPIPVVQQHPPRTYPAPPIPPAQLHVTTPSRSGPSKKALMVSSAVLTGTLLIIFAGWSVLTSSDSSDSDTSAAPSPAASDVDLQRVKAVLPKGYSDGDCTPTPDTTQPSLSCSANVDPGGPHTATYAIYPDKQALQRAFTTTVATFDRAICPGNIQSPGAWRRNSSPTQVAGTLFCGTDHGQAVVVWTSDAQTLLNVTAGSAQGPSLGQLYTWWTTHS